MIAVVLSVTAAFTFALSAMLVSHLKGRVGPLQFGRWQMSLAFLMLAPVAYAFGGWRTVTAAQVWLLAASSATGIMLASTTYFAAIHAIGPRITALMFSLASPFAVVLGYLFLGESLSSAQAVGIALILAGIMLAVAMPEGETGVERIPERRLWQGIALGVITALGQATGSLLARPAMASGVEPFAAMTIRAGLGAGFFLLLALFPFGRASQRLAPKDGVVVAISAFVGLFIGMSLLMAALARGDVGIVSTLSSTTPILILPMIWVVNRKAPGLWAWVGAALAVAGTAVLSLTA